MPPWRSRPSVIPLLGSTFLSQSGSAWNRLGYDGRKNAIERITTTPSSANRPPTFFMPASTFLSTFSTPLQGRPACPVLHAFSEHHCSIHFPSGRWPGSLRLRASGEHSNLLGPELTNLEYATREQGGQAGRPATLQHRFCAV